MSRVLVTGATGYLGSAISAELAARGHTVVGLAPTAADAAVLTARGDEALEGLITDLDLLARAAGDADGVVHAAAAPVPAWAAMERAAITTVLQALAGSGRPLLYTSGSLLHGDTTGRVAAEDSPLDPPAALAFKIDLERQVRAAAQRGVRGVVIRPASGYGNAGGGLARLLELTRRTGAAVHTGDGAALHSFVHVADLAVLYALALAGTEAGSVYLAESGDPVSTRELAESLALAAGLPGQVRQISEAQAAEIFGPLAPTLAMESVVTAAKARRELGWTPRHAGVLTDIVHGSYTATPEL